MYTLGEILQDSCKNGSRGVFLPSRAPRPFFANAAEGEDAKRSGKEEEEVCEIGATREGAGLINRFICGLST